MKNLLVILFFIQLSNLTSQAQWFTQQSGVTNHLYDMEFINRNTGWICGTGGTILKTTNGGTNWIQQVTNVPTKPLFGIHPVNENVVYAVGWFSTILKTTNGGNNWIAIEDGGPPVYGNYFSVFFKNELTGWIGENNTMGQGDVKKTTDGGMTFISSYTFGWPEDMYFKDSLNGIGVSGAANIHKTTNGGNNWISFQLAGSGDFFRVSFINDFTGFVIGGATEILYKTTNFGQSWNNIGIIPNVTGNSIDFLNDSVGWVGGNNGIYKTINGGTNWIKQIGTGVIYTIMAINDSLVWGCSNLGRIWHTTNGGDTITSINQISVNVPEELELLQNYPNPFNSQTKITFIIKQSGKYSLEIYNNLGQRIIEIFNKKISAGEYETTIDASDLYSGVYFYKLTGNNLSITKNFVLIK